MTKYELLDLRATYGERLTSMAKFWLTLTFAVFGGAYYLKENPDQFSTMALILFYGISSFLSGMTMMSLTGFIALLAGEHSAMFSSETDRVAGQDSLLTRRAKRTVYSLFALMGVTFVAFCFYATRSG